MLILSFFDLSPTVALDVDLAAREEERVWVKRQTDGIVEFAKDAHKAFSPLGPDGRPIRK